MQEQNVEEAELEEYRLLTGKVVLEIIPERIENDPSKKNFGKKYRAKNQVDIYVVS